MVTNCVEHGSVLYESLNGQQSDSYQYLAIVCNQKLAEVLCMTSVRTQA